MKRPRRKSKGRDGAAAAGKPATAGGREYRVMTVALIREPKEADAMEVAFSESARFYRLPRVNPEFERISQELREAKDTKRPVLVSIESPQSNVIVDMKL